MFTAKYGIRLKKDVFTSKYASCLGAQLLQLLNFIEDFLPPHTWYGADIDANFKTDQLVRLGSFSLKKIGNISSIKEIAEKTDQFFSGVFVAVKIGINISKNFIEISTEDPEFRPLAIDGVLVEIRAFDSSYFEVYTDDHEFIKNISINYKAKISTSDNKVNY